MADTWYIRKGNGVVTGPFSSPQLKRMADEGKIDEHTPLSKDEGGPFTRAGNVKGLIPPTAAPTGALPRFEGESAMDSVDFHRPELEADEPRAKKRSRYEPADDLKEPSYLALWSFGISAGMIVAMIIYGVAWKFAGPVWAYGTALIPLSVTLFIVGGFPYLQRKSRLNRMAVMSNSLFLVLTLVAGIGTVYDLWTLESRIKSSAPRTFRVEDPARLP